MIQLVKEKFSNITKEEWQNVCNHVENLETEYLQRKHIIDDIMDRSLTFTINTGESLDEWEDDSVADDDKDDEF
ncbi:hypothetical protein ILUMI_18536 [Ignelater luminosus]|uniref:Uncharacterized protein n=1 Tax=Ignelater luminosus TaxID=2038154 RepID=A0A8K0G415_IGNLU|nr:hypothetical protein ILUMI_18536 [Ignelater luminosus]